MWRTESDGGRIRFGWMHRRNVGFVDFSDNASAMTARSMYTGWQGWANPNDHSASGLQIETAKSSTTRGQKRLRGDGQPSEEAMPRQPGAGGGMGNAHMGSGPGQGQMGGMMGGMPAGSGYNPSMPGMGMGMGMEGGMGMNVPAGGEQMLGGMMQGGMGGGYGMQQQQQQPMGMGQGMDYPRDPRADLGGRGPSGMGGGMAGGVAGGMAGPQPVGMGGGMMGAGGPAPPRMGGPGEMMNLPQEATPTLYLDGVPFNIPKREIAHIFRPFEGFKYVRYVTRDSQKVEGEKVNLIFVEFSTAAAAYNARETVQGYPLDLEDKNSAVLKISFARPPKGGAKGRR